MAMGIILDGNSFVHCCCTCMATNIRIHGYNGKMVNEIIKVLEHPLRTHQFGARINIIFTTTTKTWNGGQRKIYYIGNCIIINEA